MLLENPYERNGSVYDPHVSFRYRQMKCAICAASSLRVFGTDMHDSCLGMLAENLSGLMCTLWHEHTLSFEQTGYT